MAELQKFIQSSNGAFKSDLMKSFVAKHRGGYSPSSAGPGFTGAGIFPPSTTTTTTSTTTGVDTTDNANIMMQNVDNNQTSATTTNTTTNTTNTNTTLPTTQDNLNENNGNNRNINNANRNNTQQTSTPTTTPTTIPTPTTTNANTNTNNTTASPEQPDTNANVSEVHAILEEVKRAVPEAVQMLVQQITDATVDAHVATCMNTHKAVSEARQRFMAMKEAGQLPDMSKLSLSAGSMWEKMTDQMMPEIGKAIKFCKMLPGFSELPLEDQMKLIKHGSFEVMMTRFAMLIDHEKETMLDPSHKMVCPRAVVLAMPMGKFLDGFFHVGAQFNPIGLTDGEIGLFTAVLIFSPCRPGLADIKLVSNIQNLYQQALFNLMKQNHSDPEEKFSKALGLVPMFRRINEEHSKALGAMKMQSPDAFDKQFPPLHKELYVESQQ